MHVPQPAGMENAFTFDRHRPGRLPAHRPVRDVKVVRTPARDHARAELFTAQPARTRGELRVVLLVDAVFGVRCLRRGAQPHVVIQIRRHRHRLRPSAARIAGQPDLDGGDLAEAPVAHQLAGAVKLRRGALLRAEQKDAPVPADRVAEEPPLGDGQRGGLLHVHVLARERRFHGGLAVPVVGRRDGHRVDVLAGKQLVIVLVQPQCDRGTLVGVMLIQIRFAQRHPPRVQIGNRDNPHAAACQDSRHVHAFGDPPETDLSHLDRLARCRLPQHPRRDDRWKGRCPHPRRPRLDRRSACHLLHRVAPCFGQRLSLKKTRITVSNKRVLFHCILSSISCNILSCTSPAVQPSATS